MGQLSTFAVLVGAMLICDRAWADPEPMSPGAQPRPMTTSQVAIEHERLDIAVTDKTMKVTAELRLDNPGPAVALRVGFPCEAKPDDLMATLPCKTPMQVLIDGRKVRLDRGAADGPGAHLLWNMAFPEKAKVRLSLRYTVRLPRTNYSTPLRGMGMLRYALRTGARWAGPIGELEMTVRIPVQPLLHISPPGYTRTNDVITWKLKAYEPDRDLVLSLSPMLTGSYTGRKGAMRRSTLRQQLQDEEGVREHVEMVSWFHEAVNEQFRAEERLQRPPETEVRECIAESLRLLDEDVK